MPSKFITETFKEHKRYYGAFFAILEAERAHDPATNMPFTKLKSRRFNAHESSRDMMAGLEASGYNPSILINEIESASQRKSRQDSMYTILLPLRSSQ